MNLRSLSGFNASTGSPEKSPSTPTTNGSSLSTSAPSVSTSYLIWTRGLRTRSSLSWMLAKALSPLNVGAARAPRPYRHMTAQPSVFVLVRHSIRCSIIPAPDRLRADAGHLQELAAASGVGQELVKQVDQVHASARHQRLDCIGNGRMRLHAAEERRDAQQLGERLLARSDFGCAMACKTSIGLGSGHIGLVGRNRGGLRRRITEHGAISVGDFGENVAGIRR